MLKKKTIEEHNQRFSRVLKDDNTSCIINQEVFALKLVCNKLMSKVEKEFLLQALRHPFLVQLLAYFQTKESFCDLMEYCKGGTLHSLMSRLKRFHEDLARFYVAETILAVNFLHKCGIIHRDIKPGNIFLDRDGHLKYLTLDCPKSERLNGCGRQVCLRMKRIWPQRFIRAPPKVSLL